jgi:hypothetical protein
MEMLKIIGALFISVCPVIVSAFIYYEMAQRTKELEKICRDLMSARQSLEFKLADAPNFDFVFTSKVLRTDEKEQISLFSDAYSVKSSKLLIDDCDVLISSFKSKADAARVDFSKKGKITAAFGLSIGAVIFILMM